MNTPPRYKSPSALREAFERRHRSEPARQLVLIMQRFAARVCRHIDGAVIKGGLGLELRLDTPRTTKDADTIIAGSHELEQRLQAAGMLDLGDFLRFRVIPDKQGPSFLVPGMPYPGQRFGVQAFFADRWPAPNQPFRKFSVEISVREAAEFTTLESHWPGFEQVPRVELRVYDIHWQLAEKVHAYTDLRHRDATNSGMWRPRDLVDLCRCATSSTDLGLDADKLRHTLEQTFERRRQAAETLHALPGRLPELPSAWAAQFDQIITEAQLPWTVDSAHELAARLIDPVLGGHAKGRWSPAHGWLGE
jgi:hypothetical protein